jgi:hypothetical protein
MGTRVVMDPVKLAEVLRGPNGPVVRRLIQDGEAVKQEAKRLVRVHKPVPGERRTRRPGQLRDSIVKRVTSSGGEVVVQVGSDDPIALIEHNDTPPHTITGRPKLVFYWPKAGRVVAFPRVNHPGTTGSRYLTKALQVLRRRY